MFTVSRAVPVNDESRDHPTLTRSDVWRGLVMKAENALPFVEGMTYCEVLERGENELVREVEFKGERAKEHVTFEPERKVQFDRLSGRTMGTIKNEIEEDEDGELALRFTFSLEVEGIEPDSDEERAHAETMKEAYLGAVAATLGAIRRSKAEDRLEASSA